MRVAKRLAKNLPMFMMAIILILMIFMQIKMEGYAPHFNASLASSTSDVFEDGDTSSKHGKANRPSSIFAVSIDKQDGAQ